ncbi:MAG: hypothetical protein ACLPWS_20995 [Rhodomicrobium sp.]
MEIDTFRKWLAERGCHFNSPPHQRGEGHRHLMIHREGGVAELPFAGSHHQLNAGAFRHVCETLGLDEMELPGPKGRA